MTTSTEYTLLKLYVNMRKPDRQGRLGPFYRILPPGAEIREAPWSRVLASGSERAMLSARWLMMQPSVKGAGHG